MTALVRYRIRGTGASAIAASVEDALRAGALLPGALLPPVRTLAADLEVSPTTVASAYRLLAARGLVSGQGRRGTRITPRPPLRTPVPTPVPEQLRDLASGNPDAALLPQLPIQAIDPTPRLYGGERVEPKLIDGLPADGLSVVGGALDGLERVLQAHLRSGDHVAVEDPGYTGVLDLVSGLGLVPEPVALDDFGMRPDSFADALRRAARAVIVTPRAQNPTGAALDAKRAKALSAILDRHPDVLLLEDDHAGPVAGAPAHTLAHPKRARWAIVRSVSKSLGPDLRLAFLAGDATTLARVEGRQHVGSGWVSHVLQQLVVALMTSPGVDTRLRHAVETYTSRRQALLDALGTHGIVAVGRSGMNVWIPVPEEQSVVAALAAAGYAIRAGERYRLRSSPGVRVTTAALRDEDARLVAAALANVLGPSARTRSA
jgi:DNA-binding transcriptional MocR family regulator